MNTASFCSKNTKPAPPFRPMSPMIANTIAAPNQIASLSVIPVPVRPDRNPD
jgi:hypothetical protein